MAVTSGGNVKEQVQFVEYICTLQLNITYWTPVLTVFQDFTQMLWMSEYVHAFILQVLNHSTKLHSPIVSVVSFRPLHLAMAAVVFVVQQEAP